MRLLVFYGAAQWKAHRNVVPTLSSWQQQSDDVVVETGELPQRRAGVALAVGTYTVTITGLLLTQQISFQVKNPSFG